MSEQPPTFEVRHLTRTFPGQVEALRGVDLVVASGDTVAITGPSGCGKSTLLHLLAAIDVPTSGSILAAGKDLSEWGDLSAYRRRYVGLVFQFHDLLPRIPVSANVELPMFGTGRSPRQRRQRALELLELVDMGFAAQRLPTEISGGERQRVAIARALANDPTVLLADEPTGSLDSASTERVIDLFRDLRDAGRTIVLVTHASEVAAVADVVVHMRDGVVIGSSPERVATGPRRPAGDGRPAQAPPARSTGNRERTVAEGMANPMF
jgi:putative ABC transport system ATP-binding protein